MFVYIMVWKKLLNPDPGTATRFGGLDIDKISDLFSGVANVDEVDINSNFRLRKYLDIDAVTEPASPPAGRIRLFGHITDGKFKGKRDTGTVIDMEGGGGGAGGVGAAGTATFSGNAVNKVFSIVHGLGQLPTFVSVEPGSVDALGEYRITRDATNIVITYQTPPPTGSSNVSFEWGAGLNAVNPTVSGINAAGVSTQSGNSSTTVFNIPHGLSGIPDFVTVTPASVDARGEYITTKDATNIIVTYPIAPSTGTNNLVFQWGAAFVSSAPSNFTPTSIHTVTGKTVGDNLKFIKVVIPADPALEDCEIYWKQIDANNNGLFIKGKKAGAIVEGQIF